MKSNVWLVILSLTVLSFESNAINLSPRSRRVLGDSASSSTPAQGSNPSNNRLATAVRQDSPTGTGAVAATGSTAGSGTPSSRCPENTKIVFLPGERVSCEPIPFDEQIKLEACKNPTSAQCIAARNKVLGLGLCGDAEKEARTALTKFSQSCAEAGYPEGRSCMREAYLCSKELGRDRRQSYAEENAFLKAFGLDYLTQSKRQSNEKKCSQYGLKEYQNEKRERSRNFRTIRRDIDQLVKERGQEQRDAATKTKELKNDLVEVQTKLREKMTEEQRSQAEEGLSLQKQMAEMDDQIAGLRSKTFERRIQSAKIIGDRAIAMAELSDAMIEANCMAAVEEVIKKWNSGQLVNGGLSGASMQYAEKKRRVVAIKENCYAQAEAKRKATYDAYKAQLDGLENEALENNRRAQALEQQKGRLTTNNAQALERLQASQQQAGQEAYQKQVALMNELQESQKSQVLQDAATAKQIKQAEEELNEAEQELSDLGRPPKGLKTPSEAAAAFSAFTASAKQLEENEQCESEFKKIKTILEKEDLLHYYENGLAPHPNDPADDNEDDEDVSSGIRGVN